MKKIKLFTCIVILFFGCSSNHEIGNLNKYVVKKGHSQFTPKKSVMIPFRVGDQINITISFDKSCLYYWPNDNDFYDFNKISIFSRSDINNKDSFMIGWRPSDDRKTIEVTWYFNDRDGNKWYSKSLIKKVFPFEEIEAFVYPTDSRGGYHFGFYGKDKNTVDKYSFGNYDNLVKYIETPWFGGKDNEPGQYGGTASKSMSILVNTKFYFKNE